MTPKTNGTSTSDHPDAGIADMTLFMSQTRASPLAVHGDTLVQSVGTELRAWNMMTMERSDTWALPHRHLCFTRDGTLIAFGFSPGGPETAIHRIVGRNVTTLPGPILPRSANVVVPGRTVDELFVSAGDKIYVLQARTGVYDLETIFDHPYPNAPNRDQLIEAGDGRIVALANGGGVRRISVHPESTAAYANPQRRIMHLAPATSDRIWYSFSTVADDGNARVLVLAQLDDTDELLTDVRTIDLAPGRIVHLASHGDTAVALVITLDQTKATWSMVVVDASGKERWRADVPDDFSPRGALNHGFVALGDHRAVLASPDGKLLAWDAANGAPVARAVTPAP